MKERYYWIDWMKVIGIYFIIAGHFFPVGNEYIYAFSVPLFFIISGFLGKREDDNALFWKKLHKNLILPCIVICVIVHLLDIISSIRLHIFRWEHIPQHILNCIVGIHGLDADAGGLGMCWFIYTLAICKIISQFVGKNRILFIVTLLLCVAISIVYNEQGLHLRNAIVNTTLAFPIFAMGGGINSFLKGGEMKISSVVLLLLLTVSLVVLYFIGRSNGDVRMYDNNYGNNLLLFFVGGISGTMAVFAISYGLRKIKLQFVDVISKGTIVILGFHQLFIRLYSHIPKSQDLVITDYIVSLVILVFFIPIIILSERYFPVLLGTRAKIKYNG